MPNNSCYPIDWTEAPKQQPATWAKYCPPWVTTPVVIIGTGGNGDDGGDGGDTGGGGNDGGGGDTGGGGDDGGGGTTPPVQGAIVNWTDLSNHPLWYGLNTWSDPIS